MPTPHIVVPLAAVQTHHRALLRAECTKLGTPYPPLAYDTRGNVLPGVAGALQLDDAYEVSDDETMAAIAVPEHLVSELGKVQRIHGGANVRLPAAVSLSTDTRFAGLQARKAARETQRLEALATEEET
jgi:hypothetical protein